MNALDTAKRYFELSNDSDFVAISELFADQAKYSSQTTGEYVGKNDIVAMQKAFHGKFKVKVWNINNIREIRPGVILIDYDFNGETVGGEKIRSSGFENIYLKNGLIIRIEIRNKAQKI